jgi:hypothetical protein
MVDTVHNIELSANPTERNEPNVGELWRWEFSVGDGTWMLQAVSARAREEWWYNYDTVIVKQGDVLLVMSLDDVGPAQLPDVRGFEEKQSAKKRWLVALVHDRLVWVTVDDMVMVARRIDV